MATDISGILMPQIPTDRRVEEAVENPKGYFRAARLRARAEVLAEIADEHRQLLNRRRNSGRRILRTHVQAPT